MCVVLFTVDVWGLFSFSFPVDVVVFCSVPGG